MNTPCKFSLHPSFLVDYEAVLSHFWTDFIQRRRMNSMNRNVIVGLFSVWAAFVTYLTRYACIITSQHVKSYQLFATTFKKYLICALTAIYLGGVIFGSPSISVPTSSVRGRQRSMPGATAWQSHRCYGVRSHVVHGARPWTLSAVPPLMCCYFHLSSLDCIRRVIYNLRFCTQWHSVITPSLL